MVKLPEVLLRQTRARAAEKAESDYAGLVRYVSNPIGRAKWAFVDDGSLQRRLRLCWFLGWLNILVAVAVLWAAWQVSWWLLLLWLIPLIASGRINWVQIETNKELAARSLAFDNLRVMMVNPDAEELVGIREECLPYAQRLNDLIEAAQKASSDQQPEDAD